MSGIRLWKVNQLVDDGELTVLIDADAPNGWDWRWLFLRSEVEALAAVRRPRARDRRGRR
jgi:hypothetical protein